MVGAWIILTIGTIVGGTSAFAGPHDSSLIVELRRGGKIYTCSGVLVSPDTALTAGHCAEGVTALRVSNAASYQPQSPNWIPVARSFVHREYSPDDSLYGSDVALLKLRGSFPFALHYPQLSNPQIDSEVLPGMRVERIGYGGRNNENRRSLIFPRFASWNNVAYAPIAGKNFDPYAVLGDSGGPVFYRPLGPTGPVILIGIHSTWDEKTNFAYFSRISRFAAWIRSYF